MKLFFFTIGFIVVLSNTVRAQFNDSTHYYLTFNGLGNFNKTQSSKAYVLNNGFKFSIRKKQTVLNFNNGWLYGRQNDKLTNNDYSAGLDFNLSQEKTGLYYWGLGSYTTSYSLKIINQLQSGIGAAYTFVATERHELNISNGIIYETSTVRLSDSTKNAYQTFRNSLRLSFKYSIGKSIVLDGLGFLQNSLNDKQDYIIKANSSLSFKINKWLSLNTVLRYNQIEKTDRQNLLLSYGFKAETFF